MLSNEVKFHLVFSGDEVVVEDIGLSDGDKEILEIVRTRGHDKSVFVAYMAEIYPFNIAAPNWRHMSGTRQGVYVSVFINSIPGHDQNWIDLVDTLFEGEQSAIDKVFMAWLKGMLPLKSFRAWPGFHEAASLVLETRPPRV